MKHIVNISLGSSRKSASQIIRFDDGQVRITNLGVDFDSQLFETVLKSFDGKCDAICVGYLPPSIALRKGTVRHKMFEVIEKAVLETPVFNGHNLRSIYLTWAVRKAVETGQFHCENANVLFLAGLVLFDLARTMEPMANTCRFLDPWSYLRVPLILNNVAQLERYATLGSTFLEQRPIRDQTFGNWNDKLFRGWFAQKVKNSDIIVAPSIILENFDFDLLKGKTLLLDSLPPSMADALKAAKVQNCFYASPKVEGTDRSLNYAVLEALIAFRRGQDHSLSQEDILDYYSEVELEASLEQLDPQAAEIPRKFSFVIHPLSRRDLFRPRILRPLLNLPAPVTKHLEKVIAKIPGFSYGRITGIRSEATGVHSEGLIYSLGATPREMLAAKPEAIYRKLLKVAEHSQKEGVKVMGLGAFTKIVGDAGVTVATRSPVPVTTGNSLSAAATLWAAKEACLKMGLMKMVPGDQMLVDGTCMIIGATGSIGKACTSVLGANFTNVIITAINGPRLMSFQKELKAMYPNCKVHITTQPERFAAQCDLIVISTSATEEGAFSLDNVKPGCVICDVSRPLTFTAETAMKRPDVLIIESGEIELPGENLKIDCDIGLEKHVVYACLAETALLALEGRYESFTLSRNINYKKVKEIYRMARKHGARLAEIRSPNGVITDQEIELCREHALNALKNRKVG